jgi:RND family efflux transporter MFP subunit
MVTSVLACRPQNGEEEVAPVNVPTIVAETATVTRKTLVDEITARGAIATVPNKNVTVSALVAGRVTAVTVAEGDTVQVGQVIAQIDRQPLEDERRQAVAGVDQAKAELENARLNLHRNQHLFTRGIAAGKEVEDARKDVASAQAALQQANAALATAARNVDRAVILAPIAGQVVKRMVSAGEQVDGTAEQPIAEIANLDDVELAANVPAQYLSRLKVGLRATLMSDAYARRTFPGTIVGIAPIVDTATNSALARIRAPNPGHALKVGMFAEARIAVAEHANALVVPPSAIVRDQRGAAAYVVSGGIARRTAVKVGLEKRDAVEILSGLAEGQTVLTSSVYGLGEQAKLAKP